MWTVDIPWGNNAKSALIPNRILSGKRERGRGREREIEREKERENLGLSNLEQGLVKMYDLLLENLRPGLLGQGRSLHNECRYPRWDAWTNKKKKATT